MSQSVSHTYFHILFKTRKKPALTSERSTEPDDLVSLAILQYNFKRSHMAKDIIKNTAWLSLDGQVDKQPFIVENAPL